MTTTQVDSSLKNINIDGTQDCNLLCKLIVDYMPSKKCHIDNSVIPNYRIEEDQNEKHITIPGGSYINFRNTSYEATKMFFFQPSRHSIDGERYDFEVNIYHGIFEEPGNKIGMVSHNHYHSDSDERGGQHRHFHYHQNNDNDVHIETDNMNNERKNVVLCILFNQDDHKGTDSNIFFSQFVNTNTFKSTYINEGKGEVNTHKNWSLENLLPKRKSFFQYENTNSNTNELGTFIVFDSVQSIDLGILNILHHKSKQIVTSTTTPTNAQNVLYKKNIEVITDDKYKELMRAQIKDLLSMTRMSTMKSKKLIAREYMKAADNIYANQRTGGDFSGYMDDQVTAVRLASAWNNWGRGNFEKATAVNIIAIGNSLNDTEEKKFYDKISFKEDVDYLELFEGNQTVKERINTAIKNALGINSANTHDFFTSDPDSIPAYTESDDINFTKLHAPELLKMDTIRKNIFLYNKIFLLADNGFKRFTQNESRELICVRNMDQRNLDIYGTRDYTFNYTGDMNKNDFIINSSNTNKSFKNFLKNIMFYNYNTSEPLLIFGNKDDTNFQYRGYPSSETDTPIPYSANKCQTDSDCWAEGYHDCEISMRDDTFRWIKPGINTNAGGTEAEDLRDGHMDVPTGKINDFIKNISGDDINSNFTKIDGIYVPNNANKQYFVKYIVYDIGNLFHVFENDDDRKILNIYKYLLNLDNGEKYDFTNELDLTGNLNFFVNLPDSNINLEAKQLTVPQEPNLRLSIINKQNNMFSVRLPRWYLMKKILTLMAVDLGDDIEFLKDEDELDRTIDGDECQEWNSHEVHDETSWLDILNPKYTFPKNGKIWGSMFRPDKVLIKDGLLKAKMARGNREYTIDRSGNVLEEQITPDSKEARDEKANSPSEIENNIRDDSNNLARVEEAVKESNGNEDRFDNDNSDSSIKSKIKWITHNKCRNPGNYKGAPWCYTKNPNVRWQYCTNPDYSQVIARTVLLITFLFCFIIAYLAVKAIFKGELFTGFVAKLTGAAPGGGSGVGSSGASRMGK